MDRDLLNHLPVILAVARRKNFAAAASELGMGPSAVSHAVRLVEERLGVPLFARTTRSVSLTEAGAALVASAAPALQDISDRVERIRAVKGRVSGLLRLNVPRLALSMVMTSVVREMAKRFPDVTVEIFADDAIANIVEDGFDAGVGLADVMEPVVRADIAAGHLTQVLPRSSSEWPGLFLYYPKRAALAPKLRAFIDTTKEVLRHRGSYRSS